MKLLTKIKVTGIVVTLAIAAGVMAFGDEWGRSDPRTDVEEEVVVHAQFFPNRGTRPIETTVTTEGVTLLEDRLVTSPWDRPFKVPKGATVTARFIQHGPGRLNCRIDRPNRIGEPRRLEGPGQLTCTG